MQKIDPNTTARTILGLAMRSCEAGSGLARRPLCVVAGFLTLFGGCAAIQQQSATVPSPATWPSRPTVTQNDRFSSAADEEITVRGQGGERPLVGNEPTTPAPYYGRPQQPAPTYGQPAPSYAQAAPAYGQQQAPAYGQQNNAPLQAAAPYEPHGFTTQPPAPGQGFAPGQQPEIIAPGNPGVPFVGQPPLLGPDGNPIVNDPNQPIFETPGKYIPLDAYLSETQTGRFMFGVGVNSDAGVVGSIVVDEQNFDWRRVPTGWEDWRSGTAFRGGGQRFRIEAAPGTQVQRYMFNFQEPYLFDTPVSLGLSAFYYTRAFRDYLEQRLGGRVSYGYQFSPDLSGNIALRAEEIEVSQPRVVPPPQDLADVLGKNSLYSVRGQLAHDTRDNTFLATEGHYMELAFEEAFGSFTFPRFTADMRKYFLLHERPDGSGRHVLSMSGKFGIEGENTPLYERFFAGGFSTMRGFQFRGASPIVQDVIVGGNLQALGSVEYLFPITADDMLRAVTFVDFGTVERTTHIDADNFRVAPGFGLRVTIPAMGPAPIALDFAFPIAKADTDLTQVFSFFVGFGR